MKINKEIFYHANSGEELSIGDIVIFNKDTKDDELQNLIDNINLKYHGTLVMPAIFFENDDNK